MYAVRIPGYSTSVTTKSIVYITTVGSLLRV